MEEMKSLIRKACKDVFMIDVAPVITRPDEQFGDYSTNVALQIAKQVGKSPRDIAAILVEEVRVRLVGTASDVTIAGPGFINVKLNDETLLQQASSAGSDKPLVGKKVLVEYSDPNPFKPLHAGHLYTTLVGDTIARLVERAGATVTRINYGGDVGLHVGKCMWAIMRALGEDPLAQLATIQEAERPAWLGTRYVEGNTYYTDDEAAKQEIVACNRRVYEVHQQNDHESDFAQVYWTCRQWSYDYFNELYRQLQVQPFDRFIPESSVTNLGVQTVKEQLAKGTYQESDGAVIFDGEKHGLHKRVFVNSEGLPTYETKEVGLILTKWHDYEFDESIIITANEQEQYMQVVLKSIEQFAPTPVERTRHLTHGIVKLQGGVKISSRKGNGPTALDIIAAAVEAGKESGMNPSTSTILAAIKYAFAKNRVGGDIIYDPKESIALEGNSGPYLQYAHARARSILGKATAQPALDIESLQSAERTLVRKIGEYTEVLERAIAERMPHHICTYLYELAQSFNRFYEGNRVVGDSREAIRIQLVTLYADVLKDGLQLLGIQAPEHM